MNREFDGPTAAHHARANRVARAVAYLLGEEPQAIRPVAAPPTPNAGKPSNRLPLDVLV